jgi:hypothetical protein
VYTFSKLAPTPPAGFSLHGRFQKTANQNFTDSFIADEGFRGHGDLTPPHHAISASMAMDAALLEVPATTVYIAASGLHFSAFAQSKDRPGAPTEALVSVFPV